jgi:lipopolysaccharide export system permease protein
MKLNSIITRYVFKEMIAPFVVSVLVLTFIFLMTRILDITNLLVNQRVDITSVFLLLIYSMPYFLIFVMPMSVMLAILLTFLKLSADNEVVALKAGGYSTYGLLPPVFLFCFLGFLVTSFMCIRGLPWGRVSFKSLAFEVAKSNIDLALEERTFNDSFKGVTLFVSKVDMKDRALTDIFLQDARRSDTVSTVVAPKGQYFSDPEKLTFQLRLYDGVINQVSLDDKSWHSIDFETYDFNLDLARAMSSVEDCPKDEEEMSLAELRQALREASIKNDQYYLTLMEYHEKFALPFSCFVLGLIAVPLGIQSKDAKRSFGIILGLLVFLVYYVILSAGWVFGEAGIYPPIIGMWMPNLVVGVLSVYLMFMTANERPIKLIHIGLKLVKWSERLVKKTERV